MRKGFTLLELIIVVIIIGVLATLGFVQYTNVVERSRLAEAKQILGDLRSQQLAYKLDHATYGTVANLDMGVPAGANGTCAVDSGFWFQFECATATGTCTAHRCNVNGKTPTAAATCTVILDLAGAFSGSCAGI